MDGAQTLDEKNGVICLVIMFTAKVMVIKMSKMAYFSHFLLMTAIIIHSLSNYLSASERSYLALSEYALNCWILSYH